MNFVNNILLNFWKNLSNDYLIIFSCSIRQSNWLSELKEQVDTLFQNATQKISDTAFVAKVKTQNDELKSENSKLKFQMQNLNKAATELSSLKKSFIQSTNEQKQLENTVQIMINQLAQAQQQTVQDLAVVYQ